MPHKDRTSFIKVCLRVGRLLVLSVATISSALAQNPVPLINQPLVPDAVMPGGAGFTLTVNGTGFVPGAVVHWNGSALATTFVSGSQLKASVSASDIVQPGTASVTVVNPGPRGGTSNVAFFEVTTPSSSVGLSNPTGFDVADQPASVAVGDFNRDGKLDLAVANNSGNNISVLLGNGDGTFQPAVNYGVGSSPESVAVGDFNRDGKLDLAVTNINRNSISVLLGKGDGTFQAAVDYNAGSGPNSVAVGDFNRDGKLDLAVANEGTSNVSVLLGNGDGTFQAAVDYPAGPGSVSVAVGDFNRDGKLDLAVANFGGGNSGNVSVLLGNGDGTFQPAVSYAVSSGPSSGPIFVVVGDFNGDEKPDLVVADASADTVSMLLGNGDGTFQAHLNYGTGPYPVSVAVGDFNRDGRLDMAVADYQSRTVSVLLQAPMVSLSKTSLTFADQVIGTSSPSQTVTLTNTGVLTLTISSISVTGTITSDFGQTNTCDAGLPPGGRCTITITFAPTQIGPRTASVTVTDNGVGSPQNIALSGAGVVTGPNATLSATSLTFAMQLVGTTSLAKSVMLSNYGTVALSVSFSITGTYPHDFAQNNTCGSSVAPGASCTISVSFKPTGINARTANLSITDNSPGSPQTVSLSGTGTVVELNPTGLAFGVVKVGNSKSLSTTLTNVGSTTLSITGITITGPDIDEFSRVNTCGSSVAAGKSCTITVTFKPTERGGDSADVSISDNGGPSPQQVPLSGSGCVQFGNQCKTTPLSSPAARSALAANPTAAVPSPTGPSPVGTRIVDLVDSTRDDPYLAAGTKRELLVRFWYPASSNQACTPAEYTSPKVWSYFSQLTELPLPKATTNSCLDARVADGAYPVVIFTHGYTGTFTDYTFLFEDLASRGYVVASIDHTYEATAVEFPDGRFVKSMVGSHLANNWRVDDETLQFVVSVRLDDLRFVLNQLQHINNEASGPFDGKLDMSRVALAGHSLGGLTTLLGVRADSRFRAGILLDPYMSEDVSNPTLTSVLLLAAGRTEWSQNELSLWSDLQGPRFAVNFRGAEHVMPSDAVWLAKGAIQTGDMGPDKTIAAIRNYIAAFLDANLRDQPLNPLLKEPSSDYPDAEVTTQRNLLRGRP